MHNLNQDPSSLRGKLKIYTKGMHDLLEDSKTGKELSSGDINDQRYLSYLQALSLIHKDVEFLLLKHNKWEKYGLKIEEHLRYELLKKDILLLDGNIPESKSKLECFDMNINFPKLVGMLYVLEGSTMGGMMLSKSLSHILSKDKEPCINYFSAYKEDTMKRWGEFCVFLDRYEKENNVYTHEVLLGACSIYLLIKEVMDG